MVDVLRRLLDRQRRLNHQYRLLGEALEELLVWLGCPNSAVPFHAAAMERHSWQGIHPLRPAYPLRPPNFGTCFRRRYGGTLSLDIDDALATTCPSATRARGRRVPDESGTNRGDQELCIIQRREDEAVDNLLPGNARPRLADLQHPALLGRRRLRARGPCPRLRENFLDQSGVSLPHDARVRKRSRGRDDLRRGNASQAAEAANVAGAGASLDAVVEQAVGVEEASHAVCLVVDVDAGDLDAFAACATPTERPCEELSD